MKKIILAIDIQNEYITPGREFNIQEIKFSLNNAKLIIEAARNKNIPVWHMQHKQDKNVFVRDTPLSDFIEGFEPIMNERSFVKNMYSCFSSDEFSKQLALEKPEEIIIVGYGSSMCCLCTTIDGIHRGYRFTLVEDATGSRGFPHADENEMHKSAYNILRQYANVVKTAFA